MEPLRVRHHYVPQFYLKRFAVGDKPPLINVYTRGKDIFKTQLANIAVEKHFYTVNLESSGEKSDQIEKMYSKLESDTWPLFKRLATDNTLVFSDEDLTLTAFFIAHLYNRGPAFRRKQYDADIIRSRRLVEFAAQDKARFDRMTKEAGVIFKDEEEAEDVRKRWLDIDNNFEITASGGEGALISMQLNLSEEIGPIIFNKKWHLLQSSNDDYFVTSDSPVTLIDKNWIPGKIGKGFLNSTIVLPVTPNRCLLLTNGNVKREIEIIPVNRQRVLEINRNTMLHAYERLFANVASSGIKKAFDKTKGYVADQVYDIEFKQAGHQ